MHPVKYIFLIHSHQIYFQSHTSIQFTMCTHKSNRRLGVNLICCVGRGKGIFKKIFFSRKLTLNKMDLQHPACLKDSFPFILQLIWKSIGLVKSFESLDPCTFYHHPHKVIYQMEIKFELVTHRSSTLFPRETRQLSSHGPMKTVKHVHFPLFPLSIFLSFCYVYTMESGALKGKMLFWLLCWVEYWSGGYARS